MRIILEGTKRSGKTTIARLIPMLDKTGKYKYHHFTTPLSTLTREQQMEAQKQTYYHAVDSALNPSTHVIFDRFHLGEAVYGPLVRSYEPDYLRDLESKMHEETILCLVLAHPDVLKSRYNGKRDFVDYTDMDEVLFQFNYEFGESEIKRKVVIDTSSIPTEVLVKNLLAITWEDSSSYKVIG